MAEPSRSIVLVPIGDVPEEALKDMAGALERTFNVKCETGARVPVPHQAYDPVRGQYASPSVLNVLVSSAGREAGLVLGVTGVDLYAPGLNFVFGQADVRGRAAVVSLCRLHQEFYGLPPDERLFRLRAVKEAVHEVGHVHGLGHCPDPRCVMHFSNSLSDTDIKKDTLCQKCRGLLDTAHRRTQQRDGK